MEPCVHLRGDELRNWRVESRQANCEVAIETVRKLNSIHQRCRSPLTFESINEGGNLAPYLRAANHSEGGCESPSLLLTTRKRAAVLSRPFRLRCPRGNHGVNSFAR